MQRLTNVEKDVEQQRPIFDNLAWLLIFAVFIVLAMIWTGITRVETEATLGLAKASQERATIREENLKQRSLIADDLDRLNAKLAVAPAQVLDQVNSIKQMLTENHEALRQIGGGCIPTQQAAQ